MTREQVKKAFYLSYPKMLKDIELAPDFSGFSTIYIEMTTDLINKHWADLEKELIKQEQVAGQVEQVMS